MIRLVALRELRDRLRGRAFRASTAVMVLAVVGIVVFAALQGGDGPTHATIATTGGTSPRVVRTVLEAEDAFDLRIKVEPQTSGARAREAVGDGDADAALLTGPRAVLSADAPDGLEPLLRAAWHDVALRDALEQRGLSADDVSKALATAPLQVSRLDRTDDEGRTLAFVGILVLYVAIMSFGYYVASGVVEEKSTRVVEIVLSAVRPSQLLAGKVIGIGLLGLAQVAAIAVVGVAVALALGRDLPGATGETVLVSLLYFVLGYLFYACGFAAAGAIVSRQEDIQSTTAPLTVLLVASYLAALAALGDPESTLARVTSFLPPVAPLVVPARTAQGAIPAWELALSIVCTIAGIVVLLVVAARIYERSVLRLGSPLKLREALRLAAQRGA